MLQQSGCRTLLRFCRYYGAVAQMTQGSGGTNGDAGNQTMKPSDIALKQNIVRVGTHPSGFGLYFFEYKTEYRQQAGYGRRFGVIAQEVEAVVPDAVITHADGYKRVNYTMLGIQLPECSIH
jgi:hypothetical protein